MPSDLAERGATFYSQTRGSSRGFPLFSKPGFVVRRHTELVPGLGPRKLKHMADLGGFDCWKPSEGEK